MNIEEEISAQDKTSLKKAYRVRLTVASMVRQRGYLEPKGLLDENLTWEEFEIRYRGQDSQPPQQYLAFKINDETNKLLISFFNQAQAMSLDQAKQQFQNAERQQVNTIIMIFPSDPFAAKPLIVDKKARLWIEQLNQVGRQYSFELFGEDDLVYDVTKHELVPQHIILSQSEKKDLLVKYRMVDNQLPRILTSDPIARFLGLHHGDVVKIIRKSETAGLYVTYRIAM